MKDKFIVFGKPIIDQSIKDEVLDSLDNAWIGTGPKVKRFSEDFRIYTKSKNSVPVSSCTAGLKLAMIAAGIGRGDEVITTPLTFCATVNSIIHVGAKPVLVDVDKYTGLINVDEIKSSITSKTKAIIPVHLWGQVCDMDPITEIAKKHSLIVIEDAAHAIESTYKGQKIGSISDFTCFSFYANKNITTIEGGMVNTESDEYAEKIINLSNHGLSRGAWKRFSEEAYKHYEVNFPGFKNNMTDIQASLGIHQIKNIDKWQQRRKLIWDNYSESFSNLPFEIPLPIPDHFKHSRHLYTININAGICKINRDTFIKRMHENGIGTGVHYISVHMHPYYRKKYGYKDSSFRNATRISQETVSLPLSAGLNDEEVGRVIKTVNNIFN